MDSLEFSKILGGACVALLAYVGLGQISHGLFAGEPLEHPAFAVEVAEAAGGGEAKGGEAGAPAVSLGALLAKADPAAGEKVFGKCKSCHGAEKGGPNKTGPDLWGVVGRPIASHEGFAYSEPLAAHKGKPWDWASLDAWLTSPKTFAPGNKMSFAGVAKAEDRANLMAWLNAQSDAPIAPPAP